MSQDDCDMLEKLYHRYKLDEDIVPDLRLGDAVYEVDFAQWKLRSRPTGEQQSFCRERTTALLHTLNAWHAHDDDLVYWDAVGLPASPCQTAEEEARRRHGEYYTPAIATIDKGIILPEMDAGSMSLWARGSSYSRAAMMIYAVPIANAADEWFNARDELLKGRLVPATVLQCLESMQDPRSMHFPNTIQRTGTMAQFVHFTREMRPSCHDVAGFEDYCDRASIAWPSRNSIEYRCS